MSPAPSARGGDVPFLLLWDIDGTLLLRASESHAAAVWDALRVVHGLQEHQLLRDRPRAGMTDGQIAREILAAAGVEAETIDRHVDLVLEHTCRTYVPGDLAAHVSPGVDDVLAALHERDDVVQSLVTGNFEPVARRKLEAAGLDRWFDPRVGGGFGSDHEDRAHLPATARRRAGAALLPGGEPWPVDRTVVIGDTPRDIACARHDGVRVVAVATGPHAPDDLAHADAVAADAASLHDALVSIVGPGPAAAGASSAGVPAAGVSSGGGPAASASSAGVPAAGVSSGGVPAAGVSSARAPAGAPSTGVSTSGAPRPADPSATDTEVPR